MNLFNEFLELKNKQPYEVSKKLQKVGYALLAAEDLILEIDRLELPAKEFTENPSVKNVFDAREKLGKLLMNEH